MATKIKCTGKDFVDLTNPYTGEKVVTEMIVGKDGTCLFGAPDTYSTSQWMADRKSAYDAWCKKSGVYGVREGEPIKCAYTGEVLVLEESELGVRYTGGFDPRMFRPRHEYLNGITMRDGNPGDKVYTETVHVQKPGDKVVVLHHEIEMDDAHMKIAEGAMKVSGFEPPKKTKVSVSKKGRK